MELPVLSNAIIQARQQLESTAQDVKQDLATAADGISSAVTTTIAATTARAVQSIDHTVAQAEGATSGIARELWRILQADIEQWLSHHPVLSWLFTHPLITLSFGVMGIVLIGGLIQAMAQLAQRGWTALFNIPLYLIRLSARALKHFLLWAVAQGSARYRRFSLLSAKDAVALRPMIPPGEPDSRVTDSSDNRPVCLQDRASVSTIDAVTLTDIQDALQHQSQAASDRQLIEALKRLEQLGHEQTQTLQHLIELLERRTAISPKVRD